MGRAHTVAALLLSVTLTSTACSDDDAAEEERPAQSATSTTVGAGTAPATEGPNGFRPEPAEWEGCGPVECASVEVPVDYDDPAGAAIELFVARAPATGVRVGSLFYNPGGPGASAAEAAAVLPLLLPDSIGEHFDIVGVDPRGAAGSAPLDCGADHTKLYGLDPSVEDAADRTALLDGSEAYAAGCQQRSADLLPHVGTRDAARDLDAVRAAMGDAQLSYLGSSYGTAIGQVYAELFPARVRAMVLDAVLELGPTGLELAATQAKGFETALASYVDDCDERSSCPRPDALAAVEEVIALAERPGGIPAGDADRPAGPGEASTGIANALYTEARWSALDEAVGSALDGDGSGIVALADEYLSIGDFELYFAVNCLDFAWPTGDPDAFLAAGKAAAEASPHFGEPIVTDYVRCAYWPVAPEPLTSTTAPGTPPILVISTTGDPATPYEQGVAVADRLESGVLVTHEGDGHGVVGDGNACVDALVASYLLDGAAPEDGTVCR
ncbi:MAG: alpha/beta hydrolase [Acidimicrobiales bacterium]|nr:alpha/beta hydrolase [Acidimicrobiales bacterium]